MGPHGAYDGGRAPRRARGRLALAALLAAAPLAAQPTVRYGLVTEPARGTLVRAWGDSVESGYCVTAYRAATLRSEPRDTVYRVTHLGPVQRTGATAGGVWLRCPRGTPTLHVHAPAQQGLATDCNPSRTDRAALARSGAPFDVVQCGIASFVFLFPPERAPDRWPVFAGLLSAGLLANTVLPADRDAGGYPAGHWYWRKELTHASAAAVSRPPALTQTYATADRTLSAYTADNESTAYTGQDNSQAGAVYAKVADLNALRVAYENLRALTEDLAQFVNALVDDLQSVGLEQ